MSYSRMVEAEAGLVAEVARWLAAADALAPAFTSVGKAGQT
jgi:hypothetical protein